MTPELQRALTTFVSESTELINDVEQLLLAYEGASSIKVESVDVLFRCIHTIKGSAGLFGLDELVRFAHQFECLLDLLRREDISFSSELMALMLRSNDALRQMVEEVESYGRCSVPVGAEQMFQDFEHVLPSIESPLSSIVEPNAVHDGDWHISFRPNADVFQQGLDPISFIHYLSTLAELKQIDVSEQKLIDVGENFDPELCYIGFEIQCSGELSDQIILDAFEFIAPESTLLIIPPESSKKQQQTAEKTPSPFSHDGEVKSHNPALKKMKTLRVEADKLDQLIDLVGEMVITGARTNLLAHQTGNEPLIEAMAQLERLVESIRDSSLQLRMVQIGDTFNRFKRIVRDTANELGKDVDLLVSGAETELDKTFIEKLNDPLTHLVRNAIDHGIESREERIDCGKSAAGSLRLNAYHDSGSIVIEVSDDGRGIDEERIYGLAKERGLIEPNKQLSGSDIRQLLFKPGFSTRGEVTDLSGRGVGMDVVKRNIELLNGSVELDSEYGKGSKFSIRLPMTLSIIDGFMFKVAGSDYVIPLDNVVECLEFNEVADANGDKRFVTLRQDALPYLRLAEWFGVKSHSTVEQEAFIVVQFGSLKAGLVVDRLSGEYQTVVKPLGSLFDGLKGVSGATILGSGEVAIILDVFSLIQTALNHADTQALERFGQQEAGKGE
ncbi:chemotaxis protein CheA [Vibrio sp. NTOU-M3]|uniref:chemotaxis protein CheA n=1 Tax=Vibrio sp. NTOU-M3 TaxID=3234954 RepID=UPI00349F70C9